MTPQELRDRTTRFSFGVLQFVEPLFDLPTTKDEARQLLKAARSVASNYRAAGRARSRAEFIARMGVVLEEADESEGALQRLQGCRFVNEPLRLTLLQEADQLIRIFAASIRTAKARTPQRRARTLPTG